MSAPWTFVFTGTAIFEADRKAVAFLEAAGFSVGRSQGRDPRGILFGDFDIQKWRNLRKADVAGLHGRMTTDSTHGPARVHIFASAPPEAHDALDAANTRLTAEQRTARATVAR